MAEMRSVIFVQRKAPLFLRLLVPVDEPLATFVQMSGVTLSVQSHRKLPLIVFGVEVPVLAGVRIGGQQIAERLLQLSGFLSREERSEPMNNPVLVLIQ